MPDSLWNLCEQVSTMMHNWTVGFRHCFIDCVIFCRCKEFCKVMRVIFRGTIFAPVGRQCTENQGSQATKQHNINAIPRLGTVSFVPPAATCQDGVLRQEYLNMCSASWWHKIICGIFWSKKTMLFAYMFMENAFNSMEKYGGYLDTSSKLLVTVWFFLEMIVTLEFSTVLGWGCWNQILWSRCWWIFSCPGKKTTFLTFLVLNFSGSWKECVHYPKMN